MTRSVCASRDVGTALRAATARLGAAGIATARQDAELLLARVLATSRLALHLDPRQELSAAILAAFGALVARRAGQEPIQYILAETDFCGLSLRVGPGVFIPRPETELLVERALAACPAGSPGSPLAVELCAGSGAVACALAARHPRVLVWAVERSPAALAWARENVRRLGFARRITLLEGDLFEPLVDRGLEGRCDLVVVNPPYIARPALPALPDEVRRWEPTAALDGGRDGLAVTTRTLAGAPAFLRPGGTLVVEISPEQVAEVRRRLATDGRYGSPVVRRDFLGRARVLEARRG